MTIRVVISGAGVGGFALAHHLSRNSRFAVTLLEAGPDLETKYGAGFALSGGLESLNKLPHLQAPLRKIMHPFKGLTSMDPQGHVVGQFSVENSIQHHCLRDDLQNTLAATLPEGILHLDAQVVAVDATTDRDLVSVTTQSSDGTTNSHVADVFVAADGIHSFTRNQLYPDWNRENSGMNIWYGVTDASNIPETAKQDPVFKSGHVIEAGGDGFMYMCFPCTPDRSKYTFACAYQSDEPPEAKLWENTHAAKALASHLETHTCPEIIAQVMQSPDRVMHFSLFYTNPMEHPWHSGRIVLLGDAAHATTPFAGQGANQAIKDAAYLAQLLGECPNQSEALAAAFADYEATRKPPTSAIIKQSNASGKLRTGQGPMYRFLRFALTRILFASDGYLFKKLMARQV